MTNLNVNTTPNDSEENLVGRRGKNGKPLDKFAARRVRKGKTARDHASGAWRQRQTNLADRGAWANEVRAKNGAVPPVPKAHGLGNSSKRFKLKPGKRSKSA
jgi:hypothetical protein